MPSFGRCVGEAEIEQRGMPFGRDEDVAGFDVGVDHVGRFVKYGECFGDLPCNP